MLSCWVVGSDVELESVFGIPLVVRTPNHGLLLHLPRLTAVVRVVNGMSALVGGENIHVVAFGGDGAVAARRLGQVLSCTPGLSAIG